MTCAYPAKGAVIFSQSLVTSQFSYQKQDSTDTPVPFASDLRMTPYDVLVCNQMQTHARYRDRARTKIFRGERIFALYFILRAVNDTLPTAKKAPQNRAFQSQVHEPLIAIPNPTQ